MNRSFHVRFLTVLLIAIAVPAFAQTTARTARYVVTLDAAAAIGRVEIIGAELAATYGGTLEDTRSATDDVVIIRIPRSRAGELAADPRVRSVMSPRNHITSPNVVTEPVNWTSGVPYTYDGAGNVTKIGADEFLYDDVGRLVQAKVNSATRTYEYDAFGNRRKCAHNATTDCQFGFSATSLDNHLTNVTYDPNGTGNVTRMGGHTYEYDTAQMMTSDDSGAGISEYVYTADDERIATHSTNSGRWEWTVRDGRNRIVRTFSSQDGSSGIGASSWKWVRDYVYRDGVLLASRQFDDEQAIVTYHYHVDHLGSPRRITDDSDNIAGYHDYYAFGPEVFGGLNEPAPSPLKYAGQERENQGEPYTLDYVHTRHYNPTLARFLSVDPVIMTAAMPRPQMWNRYVYVTDNPMNRIDPDGRELQALDGDAGSAEDAFHRLQRLVPDAAAGFLYLDPGDGMVRLKGISRLEFGQRFGFTAQMIANLITTQGFVSTFALANSSFAKAKGGGRTEPTDGGTRTEVGPGLIPKMAGGVPQTVETVLAHELGHAYQAMYGIPNDAPGTGRIDPRYLIQRSEGFGVWIENNYRAEKGLPHRTYYWYGPDGDYGRDYIEP